MQFLMGPPCSQNKSEITGLYQSNINFNPIESIRDQNMPTESYISFLAVVVNNEAMVCVPSL